MGQFFLESKFRRSQIRFYNPPFIEKNFSRLAFPASPLLRLAIQSAAVSFISLPTQNVN